jgi:hypothetical protein
MNVNTKGSSCRSVSISPVNKTLYGRRSKNNPKDSAWPIPLAYVVPILFIGNIFYITFTYVN